MGQTVQFDCVSHAHSEITWTFNDRPLPPNVDVLGPLQQRIQINNIHIKNYGIYKCITKDYYGCERVGQGELIVYSELYHKSLRKEYFFICFVRVI